MTLSRESLAPIVFGIFLIIAGFKGSFSLPVDLTGVFFGFVVLCVLFRLPQIQQFPGSLLLVGLLFISFIPGVLLSDWTPYSDAKILKLFTIVLAAVIAPYFLINRSNQARTFIITLSLTGLIAASDALLNKGSDTDELGRLTALESGTILSGRIVSIALIVILAIGLNRLTAGRLALLPLLAIGAASLIYTMIGTGARGPLLAVAVAILSLCTAFLFGRTDNRIGRIVAVMALVGLIAASVPFAFNNTPEGATSRLVEAGPSGEMRLHAWQIAQDTITDRVFGIGWGGYQAIAPGLLSYPHNLLLEVTVEGGWVAGIMLIAFLGRALIAGAIIQARSLSGQIIFGLLIASIVNAMFSSDITGNRLLFGLAGVALALQSAQSLESTNRTLPKELIRIDGYSVTPSLAGQPMRQNESLAPTPSPAAPGALSKTS